MSKTIQEVLAERDEKMAEYYQSVYKHGFDGGYPIAWDTEALSDIRKLIEGEAETLYFVPKNTTELGEDVFEETEAIPMEAINKIIGDTE